MSENRDNINRCQNPGCRQRRLLMLQILVTLRLANEALDEHRQNNPPPPPNQAEQPE